MSNSGSARWAKKWDLGDKGAVYEFDIKLPKIDGVDMSEAEFEAEALGSIRDFVVALRDRYTWIGEVYQTGRSGGWLAVEDKKGLATEAKLRTILGMIEKAQRDFIQYLRRTYPE